MGSKISEPHAYLVVSKAGYIAVPFDDDTIISQDLFLSSISADKYRAAEGGELSIASLTTDSTTK